MSEELTISVDRLLEKADAGEDFLLLDVRNDDEYEAWKVEGRCNIATLHIPYFDFIEDPEIVGQVPSDKSEVLVLCAKGGSSEFVADLLREAGVRAKNVAGGMEAYGDFLQTVRLSLAPEETATFEIWQLNRRGKGCLSYVVHSGDEAVVFDASRHVDEYKRFAQTLGARIVAVFDTHVHADHLSGGPELARSSGASYFVSAGNAEEVRFPVKGFKDGEEITIGGNTGVTIRFIATPGHTPGSTSFLIGRNLLLTGDTIFVSGIGRPDLGGRVEEWSRTLYQTLHEKIRTLPDDVVILPAHYSSISEAGEDGVVAGRLGDIRATARGFQIRTEEEFVEAMTAAVTPPPPIYSRIFQTNLGAAHVEPQEATEWELGKNKCAASGH